MDTQSLLGYIGQVYDVETGLSYLNARYYDPASGRFLSEDSIGFAGGDLNLYRYSANDPINRMDPSGEFFLSLLIGAIFVGGSAAATAATVSTVAGLGALGYVGYAYAMAI